MIRQGRTECRFLAQLVQRACLVALHASEQTGKLQTVPAFFFKKVCLVFKTAVQFTRVTRMVVTHNKTAKPYICRRQTIKKMQLLRA